MTTGEKIAFVFGIVLIVIVAAVTSIAAKMPDDYRYTRSATINARPAAIFAQVNNFQNWNAWSPWAKLDPNAKTTFEGPQAGKGAIMRWDGNNKVGTGSMTIIDSTPNQNVLYDLEFLKPMKGTASSEFVLEPQAGNQTLVSWSMFGHSTYVQKLMSVVMNCEKMIGKQFDEGLANLKTVVETK